jgi:hypothetical protein
MADRGNVEDEQLCQDSRRPAESVFGIRAPLIPSLSDFLKIKPHIFMSPKNMMLNI